MQGNVVKVDNEKVLNNLTDFFQGFNKLFENESIDDVVNKEFPRKYDLLPLLVKAQLYYDKH